MADHSGTPDYDLPEALELQTPEQYKALFEPTRTEIVTLLLERAATTSELATTLGKPKGTIGHHLKVLAEAGLVHVVRTKRVRALEAKYYGRTARTFYYHRVNDAVGNEQRLLTRATNEVAVVPADTDQLLGAGLRYARIPAERAAQWHRRMADLVIEFAAEPREGETTYGLVFALYPTDRPAMATEDPGPEA